MRRRPLAFGFLIVLLAALIAWLSLRNPAGDAPGPLAAEQRATPATDAPRSHELDDVAAPLAAPPAGTSGEPVLEPASAAARAAVGPEARYPNAVWVEGRVELPPGTPRDERAFVVARGRKLAGESEHRFELDADGGFRAAFAPETRKGWLDLEARYLFLPGALALEPGAPPDPLVLAPQVGGAVRLKLVPSALAEARRAELAQAKASAHAYNVEVERGLQRAAQADEQGVCELGGLDPSAQWSARVELAGFRAADVQGLPVRAGEVTEAEVPIALAAHLAGVVVDEAGEPVAGASIEVVQTAASSMSTQAGNATRDDGSFDLPALGPLTTTVRARASGFLAGEVGPVELSEGLERTGLVIRLARGNSVAGRVLWLDRTPAAGASVEIEAPGLEHTGPSFLGSDPLRVRTEEDGSFVVSGLGEGPFQIAAHARRKDERGGPRLSWSARVEDVPTGAQGLELVLALGARLAGVVVDDLGAPLGRVRVRAEQGELPARRALSERSDRESGRFEFPSIPSGVWTIVAEASGQRRSSRVLLELPRDAGREFRLVLPRPAVLAGVVLDARGAPAAGAQLKAESGPDEHGMGWSAAGFEHRSDEQGRFELRDASPGVLKLVARAAGAAPTEPLEVVAEPGRRVEGLVLRLRLGATIGGFVRDDEGRPLAGVQVAAWGGEAGGDLRARTASDGAYRLEHVAPGEAYVQLQHEAPDSSLDGASKSVRVQDGELVRLDFGGRPPGSVVVTGLVRAREPVADAELHWTHRGDEKEPMASCSVKTGADGSYSVVLPGAGAHQVWISAGELGSCGRMVEVPPGGGRIDHDLPAGAVEGRVLDPDGRGLAGVNVQLYPLAPSAEAQGWNSHAFAETGAEGRFVIGLAAPGKYDVRVRPSGPMFGERSRTSLAPGRSAEFQLARGERRTGVEIRLTRAGQIAGVVLLSDGRPAAGARVSCRVSDREVTEAATDPAGRFRFEGLAPGSVIVNADAGSGGVSTPLRAEVRPSQTCEVRIDLVPGGRLAVHLLDAQGEPQRWGAGGVHVHVDVRDGEGVAWPIVDRGPPAAFGTYVFPGLPPGEYTVSAHFEVRHVDQRVRIVSGGSEEITLRAPQ